MFEEAELGRSLPRKEYDEKLPALRAGLLEGQLALKENKHPVLVIVSGVDGAGKGEVVHCLNEWLDPRGIDTHAYWEKTDEENSRPAQWRYWRRLPAKGRIAVFFGSWYTKPIIDRVYGKTNQEALNRAAQNIVQFERMLALDGMKFVKLWFHLSKKAQRKRLKSMEKDPETRARVLPSDWKHHKLYGKFRKVCERVLLQTHTKEAPWHVIDARDDRTRNFAAAELLLKALKEAAAPQPASKAAVPSLKGIKTVTALDKVDLKRKLTPEKYKDELAHWQSEITRLTWKAKRKKVGAVLVFEGWDAAGKGSAIRRVTAAMDPRLYRVIPIAAPTQEERAYHYLWRFWRHLPQAGEIVIFDRSWYGRVLVERVEGFAAPEAWGRAYGEIKDFEQQIVSAGFCIGKFWIHISKEEQLRRFKERQVTPYKQYKITDEDWRNREKWDAYKAAVHDMVMQTSTKSAPWTLVSGNDKRYARIQILQAICRSLQAQL